MSLEYEGLAAQFRTARLPSQDLNIVVKACAEPSTSFGRNECRAQVHSGFEFRDVLLLDWLPTKAKGPNLLCYLIYS